MFGYVFFRRAFADPVVKEESQYKHCYICDPKALSDSTYSYLQDEQCAAPYPEDMTAIMSKKEKDNKWYAICNKGEVPGKSGLHTLVYILY